MFKTADEAPNTCWCDVWHRAATSRKVGRRMSYTGRELEVISWLPSPAAPRRVWRQGKAMFMCRVQLDEIQVVLMLSTYPEGSG